jgi:hypothetical protein
MSGTKGHSGGGNRKPIEAHVLRDSFRPSRHGARLAALHAAPQAIAFPVVSSPPPVPETLVAGLGAAGIALVRELWTDYEFTAATVPLLRLVGEQADRLAATREALAAQPLLVRAPSGAPIVHPMLRVEQRAVRNLMDLLKQMNLEPSAP